MFTIKIESGRYVASYSRINAIRYTDNLCNYKTMKNLNYAKKQAELYANALGQTVTIKDLDSKNIWFISPCC